MFDWHVSVQEALFGIREMTSVFREHRRTVGRRAIIIGYISLRKVNDITVFERSMTSQSSKGQWHHSLRKVNDIEFLLRYRGANVTRTCGVIFRPSTLMYPIGAFHIDDLWPLGVVVWIMLTHLTIGVAVWIVLTHLAQPPFPPARWRRTNDCWSFDNYSVFRWSFSYNYTIRWIDATPASITFHIRESYWIPLEALDSCSRAFGSRLSVYR